ncbi:MAG: hypothetical protein VB118_04470 [Oscillospiraceae bacterium]|nr:hypothetical protein [Oscillospiraceae bacterium]
MKKFLSLVVITAFLLSAFCACSPETSGKTGSTQTSTADTSAKTSEISRANTPDKLPDDIDFGGRTITLFVRGDGNEVWTESETQELINDAVYNRIQRVEDRLKCKIEVYNAGGANTDMLAAIRNQVNTGSSECDLAVCPRYYSISLAPEGCLVNLTNYSNYIDFDAPWYQKGFIKAATIGLDKIYFVTGDASYSSFTIAQGLAFNKKVYEDNLHTSADELYQLVLDKKWTLDKMIEICKGVYQDDGNGQADDKDIYGFGITPNAAMIPYVVGCGVELSKYDDDGMPELALNTPKTVEFVAKTIDLLNNTTGVFNPGTSQEAYDLTIAKFKGGTLMMTKCDIKDLGSYRDMSDDYGMLPFPMYDENQDNYRSYVGDYSTMWAIPKTAEDINSSAIFLEAFSADGYRYVTPTIYETALKKAYARDDKLSQMLDIINSTVTYDFASLHSSKLEGIEYLLIGVFGTKGSNFSSTYEAKEPAITAALEKLKADYENVFDEE